MTYSADGLRQRIVDKEPSVLVNINNNLLVGDLTGPQLFRPPLVFASLTCTPRACLARTHSPPVVRRVVRHACTGAFPVLTQSCFDT